MYNFFSEETKEYDKDLAEETQLFVDSFEGDYVSYSTFTSELSEKTRPEKDDKYSQRIMAAYIITTTEKEYMVCFYYTNEAPNKENIGLQTLGVQENEDFDVNPCICSDIHGCYVVTLDNHDEILERNEYDLEHADWY